MKNNEIEDQELSQMAPFLSKIEKRNSFDVPPGYFDALPSIIQEACIQSRKESILLRLQVYILRPRMLVSFCVLLVFAFFVYRYLPKNSTQNLAMTNISASDISETDLLISMDESILIESLPDIEFETQNTKTEIEDYLIDNNIDLSGIAGSL
jgi:hypothetical protein